MSKSEQRKLKGMLPPVRCTAEIEGLIRDKAADCGMAVGPFMLACALGRQTRSKVDEHVINELRRLGGLQKHLFNQGEGELSKEYSQVLVEITKAISRIARSELSEE